MPMAQALSLPFQEWQLNPLNPFLLTILLALTGGNHENYCDELRRLEADSNTRK